MSRTPVRQAPVVARVGDTPTVLTLGLAQLDDGRWLIGLVDRYATERIGWISYEWDPAHWTEILAKVADRGYFCFYSGDRHQASIIATYGELWKALWELGLVS